MARKRRGPPEPEEPRSAESYYRLNTKAVDDLVNASAENSPEVPEAEINAYRGKKTRFHLSETVKALLVKVWFSGSVCFFILWGLANYVADMLDLMLILGIALGIVTDLLTNNALRFIAKTEGANDRWMMFPVKKYATFIYNILYAFFLLLCVYMWYGLINTALAGPAGTAEGVALGVEPILFGVFYTCFDVLFIRMKALLRKIVSDAKHNVKG